MRIFEADPSEQTRADLRPASRFARPAMASDCGADARGRLRRRVEFISVALQERYTAAGLEQANGDATRFPVRCAASASVAYWSGRPAWTPEQLVANRSANLPAPMAIAGLFSLPCRYPTNCRRRLTLTSRA